MAVNHSKERTGILGREQSLNTRWASVISPVDFSQSSPVDTFTKNLDDDASRMRKAWKRTVGQQFKVHDRYEHVAALLVRWNDNYDRDLKCAPEVLELHRLFQDEYNYDSKVLELDTETRPQQQLNLAIAELVGRHDGHHSKHLLIVYYSGHGIGREPGELDLAALPNNDYPCIGKHRPKLSWTLAERDLNLAEADVLTILDCCAAGIIIKKGISGETTVQSHANGGLSVNSAASRSSRLSGDSIAIQFLDTIKDQLHSTRGTASSDDTGSQARVHEVFIACGGRQKAEKPGDKSFTRHFIDILREDLESDRLPICTFDLNSRITRQRPDVTSSSQVFPRHPHMRHKRFIQLGPVNRPTKEDDESTAIVKRSRGRAYLDISVSTSKTTFSDMEVERLATEFSNAAERAHLDITSIELNGFQLTPDVIRFQRTLWRLTRTVFYFRRWKRLVRKKLKRKASDSLDDSEASVSKRRAPEDSNAYLSAASMNMPMSPSPSNLSVTETGTPQPLHEQENPA